MLGLLHYWRTDSVDNVIKGIAYDDIIATTSPSTNSPFTPTPTTPAADPTPTSDITDTTTTETVDTIENNDVTPLSPEVGPVVCRY